MTFIKKLSKVSNTLSCLYLRSEAGRCLPAHRGHWTAASFRRKTNQTTHPITVLLNLLPLRTGDYLFNTVENCFVFAQVENCDCGGRWLGSSCILWIEKATPLHCLINYRHKPLSLYILMKQVNIFLS